MYHWDNEIQHDQEWLLLIKTTDDMSEALKEAIMKIHPYDSPELISVDVTDGLPDYLQWVQDTVNDKIAVPVTLALLLIVAARRLPRHKVRLPVITKSFYRSTKP